MAAAGLTCLDQGEGELDLFCGNFLQIQTYHPCMVYEIDTTIAEEGPPASRLPDQTQRYRREFHNSSRISGEGDSPPTQKSLGDLFLKGLLELHPSEPVSPHPTLNKRGFSRRP